jgi:hypothetical protein
LVVAVESQAVGGFIGEAAATPAAEVSPRFGDLADLLAGLTGGVGDISLSSASISGKSISFSSWWQL